MSIATPKTRILSRFSGGDQVPLYLPDLTLWYKWHYARGTLPERWKGDSLSQISRAMGVPIWAVARPWRAETLGVNAETVERDEERISSWETPAGTLTARWTIGPDGDWWQAEHLVKTSEDLAAAVELAQSRSYVVDASELAQLQAEVGDDGVLALEIPRRPYSELLHDYLGWGEGLLMLGEPAVSEIVAALEAELQRLVDQVAHLPGQIVFSPDNLDGQFISPVAFKRNLADSYSRTAETLHQNGKCALVHAGGPVSHLLAALAASGVDGVEGIAGPPQSDASLAQARAIAGPTFTLWGGIPQDFVLETYGTKAFEDAVTRAAQEASGDGRMILGIVDRVPVDADLSRLEAIPSLIERALAD